MFDKNDRAGLGLVYLGYVFVQMSGDKIVMLACDGRWWRIMTDH